MRTVAFFTLGCKINLLESEVMQEDLCSRGYLLTDDYDLADIVIINSCTVTEKADRKFKDFVNRVKKNNPQAIIAAAGCFTELNPEKAASYGGIDLILGSEKLSLPEELEKITAKTGETKIITQKELTVFEEYQIQKFSEHTRAFLKIQDGCDNFCTYCTIPKARGKSRSRNLEHILTDVQNLSVAGYHEVVISGIDLGSYRYETVDGKTIKLLDVLKAILEIKGFRIRIGSLEPWCIDDELADLLINEERICPHFHIPLQGGSNRTLKRMNRKYDIAEFDRMVKKLAQRKGVLLATDIIVGFPGESEQEFQESCNYLKESDLTYAHVFSYSDRPHAAATKLPDKTSKSVIKQRSEYLRGISDQKRHDFYHEQIGSCVTVLIETEKKSILQGYTENYLPVKIADQSHAFKKGDLVKTRIASLQDNWLIGEIEDMSL